MNSGKWSLNQQDWERWSFNLVRFVLVPTLLAFLVSLNGGLDVKVAWGVALGTLYTSVIDLLRKFAAANPTIQ